MFGTSELSPEQRARIQAMRAARKLLRKNTIDPSTAEILRVTEIILKGDTNARR